LRNQGVLFFCSEPYPNVANLFIVIYFLEWKFLKSKNVRKSHQN